MKKSYQAPAVEREDVMLEQGIAVSEAIYIENNTVEDWEEGNTNWW